MAKERRGAGLVITKSDGQQIKGELIAVKETALLLLDSQSGADVSVEIGEIAVIKIIKKSKALSVGAIGFGLGALYGFSAMQEEAEVPGETLSTTIIFGILATIPGALIGAYLGTDKTIQLEGKSPEEINAELAKLRKQARITDFQ
jgi:hypothetical protein